MISSSPLATSFELSAEIRMRRATVKDLPLLEWYGQYTHFRRVYKRTFADQQAGNRLMLVADLNGFPIGQVFLLFKVPKEHQRDPYAYLYSFRVMTHLRGMGIGTRLLQFAEQLLIQRGYIWALISATKENQRARKLYERLGYTVFAEDDGKWSYENHEGKTISMHEPCWMLHKKLP